MTGAEEAGILRMTLPGRRRALLIESADGKDLIASIKKSSDTFSFNVFFKKRSKWCHGYPLVHDGLVTYGAFDDLVEALSGDERFILLPSAIDLVVTVPDREFHAALGLLAHLFPDDAIRPRPPGLSDTLLRIRLRGERLSFLPNLSCAWDAIARKQRCLKSEDDFLRRYSPSQLAISDSAWQRFYGLPLRNLTRGRFVNCFLPFLRVRQYIQIRGANPGERELVYATQVEEARYWVWRIPGRTGTAHLFKFLFFRVESDGTVRVGEKDIYRQFAERGTPGEITQWILNIEFSFPQIPTLDQAMELLENRKTSNGREA